MSDYIKNKRLVRCVTARGTSSVVTPVSPISFMGEEDKKRDLSRLKLAGDLWIMSGKGTTKIKLSDMQTPKSPEMKGFYISTGKGTGRIKL